MPIYEYECKECGHQLESIQKMNDPHLVDCPKCLKPALRKLVSAAGFQLKGGGWYVTDFRDKGKKKESKPESGSESDSGAGTKSENKTDAKADVKTDAKSETKSEAKQDAKTEKPKSGSGGTEAA